MRIVTYYSHLNGLEFLQVHKPGLWREIQEVIASLDAKSCRTKVSKEIRTKDKLLFSPIAMNEKLKHAFTGHGWNESRTSYWVTSDAKLIRKTKTHPQDNAYVRSGTAGGNSEGGRQAHRLL